MLRKCTIISVLMASVLATSAYAGGSLFGHKTKTVNTNGVHSIGVHICGSLECPPVRIFEGKCNQDHMSMHWGVCVCDKGYVPKNGKCDACPEGQYSDGIHNCQICPEGQYIAHTGDTTCTKCPDGYYCVGGIKYACPDYATCTISSFECNEGFTISPTSCTCPSGKYIDGEVCKACPDYATCDGNTFTCGDGYSNGDNVCVCEGDKYEDGGICKDCPSYSDCNADECCTLTGPDDICGNPTPVFFGFKDKGGTCRDCSSIAGYFSNADECAKCDTTSTPREMFTYDLGDTYCALPCPTGQIHTHDGGICVDCLTPYGIYGASSDECKKCDTTAIPREMFTNGWGDPYCALLCPEGQIHNWDGTCVDCSTADDIWGISADECKKCDTTSTPRQMDGDTCVLK